MNFLTLVYFSDISIIVVQSPSPVWLCNPMDCSTSGLPVTSPVPEICPSSCLLHWWCHPDISSSDTVFFCPQSFPESGTFPMIPLFASGSQNIGGSASVLPMSIPGWFPLRLAGFISYCPRDFQESSPAPEFQGINSLVLCLLKSPAYRTIHDHWEDHSLDYMDIYWQSNVSAFQHTV